MNKKVYIIVVNYNGWQDTVECVESILKSEYENYQVIIVDNNSPNASMVYLKAWLNGNINVWMPTSHPLSWIYYPNREQQIDSIVIENEDSFFKHKRLNNKVILVKANINQGFSAGNNIALKYIIDKGEDCLVWLLNPDMVIEKSSLSELVSCTHHSRSNCFGTLHKSYNNPIETILYGGWKIFPLLGIVRPILNEEKSNEIDFISGGNLFTNINNFKEIGFLPEEYFLYWEEADWCTKAKRLGKKFTVCENSICYDKGSTSIGSGSSLAEYLYTLNSLRYAQKFYGGFHVLSITFFQIVKVFKRVAILKFTSARAVINGIKNFYFRKNNEL